MSVQEIVAELQETMTIIAIAAASAGFLSGLLVAMIFLI
jgi:hypothetical protein